MKHNLGYTQLQTGNMGELLPCGVVEVLPGDTFQHSTSAVIRLSPLAAPVMHPASVHLKHYFVPSRLSWDQATSGGKFEDFITGGEDGTDSQTPPTINTTGTANDLLDYFGLPQESGVAVNSMPIRAYNLIYNEHIRDQDLIAERALGDLTIPKVRWESDYFTRARPWAQKGDEVTLPLGTRADVKGLGFTTQSYTAGSGTLYETGDSAGGSAYAGERLSDSTTNPLHIEEDPANLGYPNIYADLENATATNINAVKRAFAIQRFQENRAQYGSRYSEYLKHYGVRNQDARLNRPEYLGGGKVSVQVSEVLQTSPDLVGSPEYGVGEMYGHGIAAMRSNKYRKRFSEHGHVISVISMRPKAIYSNGVNRSWLRQVKEDYFQKELAHIGQQEIWRDEVYATAASGGRDTWGYSDRYAEYRSQESHATSEFRTILDHWHLSRDFTSLPGLNQSFVDCDPSLRIFNVQTNDVLWMQIQHHLTAHRSVPNNSSSRII
jgi:hypothetical protein